MGVKNMNIGVIISSGLNAGGGYQYEYMVLDILKRHHKNKNISLNYYCSNKNILKDYSDLNINIKLIKENIFQKFHRLCLTNIFIYKFLNKIGLGKSLIEKKLTKDNIDLVYFLSPNLKSLGLGDIPYIFTLWDLGHIDILEFPEVSHERRFELREFNYTKSLKKAISVIVDLDYGKQNVMKRYNLDEHRVEVLKFLPNIRKIESSSSIDVKEKYNLKNEYIFYPAQFWAHKNHIYILKAIKILREQSGIDLDVVFSGTDKGNLNYILEKSRQFGIDDLIHYIGFAPNEEIPMLYKQSLALVMPTFLGPTNIPPLEAFVYDTPVCYSDTPFFREQLGDSVFYIDLNDPKSLIENLLTIKNNEEITKGKKIKGREILENWSEEDFYNNLSLIFNKFKDIRDTWR